MTGLSQITHDERNADRCALFAALLELFRFLLVTDLRPSNHLCSCHSAIPDIQVTPNNTTSGSGFVYVDLYIVSGNLATFWKIG
jgi:hypothetical protein